MAIEFGVVNREDHETCIRAMWGTKEKMLSSPLFQETMARIEYLITLQIHLEEIIKEESARSPWWRPIKFASAQIAKFSYNYVVGDRIDNLIKTYKSQLGLPVGFVIKMTDDKMTEFLKSIKEMVKIRNQQRGITNDPYLESIENES